jgi:hypothetical protein
MGLTIHYGLHLEGTSIRSAKAALEALRQKALDLPFEEVSDLFEYRGDACKFERPAPGEQTEDDDPHRWVKIQASHYLDVPGSERDFGHGHRSSCSVTLDPIHIIGFSTWPGPGSEQANFGLCLFPGTAEVPLFRQGIEVWPRRTRRVRTDLGGRWTWGSFCKTHYASNPECGGITNFIRCHLVVVSLLDLAKDLGLLEDVHDEGEYWEKRDIEALSSEMGEQSAMVAAFAGLLSGALPEGVNLEAPITAYPEFERLEAEGMDSLPLGTEELARLIGPLAKAAVAEAETKYKAKEDADTP